MPTSSRWEERLLYAFLVGRLDRTGKPVATDSIADALLDLYGSLRGSLGGLSYLKPFEAVGETTVWSTEPTSIVLVLVDHADERVADSVIAEHAARLRLDLLQEEVWVTKQEIQLYVPR